MDTSSPGTLSGSNSCYTLFNHGGPHVDAPNHVGVPLNIKDGDGMIVRPIVLVY
jgi:kynurenine formamidase